MTFFCDRVYIDRLIFLNNHLRRSDGFIPINFIKPTMDVFQNEHEPILVLSVKVDKSKKNIKKSVAQPVATTPNFNQLLMTHDGVVFSM